MRNAKTSFLHDQRGSAGVEYGLMAVGFVAVVVVVAEFLGGSLGDVQSAVAATLSGAGR